MELEPFNSFLLERLSDLAFLQNTTPKFEETLKSWKKRCYIM